MNAQSVSTIAYAIRRTAKGIASPCFVIPALRGRDVPLYMSRGGFSHQYSSLQDAELFAKKSEAQYYCERGEKPVKVRVTITEEV